MDYCVCGVRERAQEQPAGDIEETKQRNREETETNCKQNTQLYSTLPLLFTVALCVRVCGGGGFVPQVLVLIPT